MSLINDALKRAKEAQKHAPLPEPDLPFRPVDPAQQRARRGLGLLVPAVLAVIACLALLLVWQAVQSRQARAPIEAAARTAPPPAPAAVDAGDGVPLAPAGAAADDVATDAATDTADAMLADSQENEPADAAPVMAPAPPKPDPLRLQGVVFNPKRPSAMISGKQVFVGDKIREFRVLAIDQDSATLVGAGETNVLSLPE